MKKPSNENTQKGEDKLSDSYLNKELDIPSFLEQRIDKKKSNKFLHVETSKKSVISQMLDGSSNISLSTVKANWYFGEWQSLIELDVQALNEHPDVATFAALKAAGYQQLNDIEKSKTYFRLAKKLGCDNYLISQLLIAGVHNALGKVAALTQSDDKMQAHFDAAVNVGGNKQENKLAKQARAIKEMATLGLLPQAAKLLTTEKETLNLLSIRPSVTEAKLKMLSSEVEIINHELMLAYQKSQLYANTSEEYSIYNADGSVNKERLKRLSPSQLGQDLWVLEQTNYKKGGFFVEFGATDGVLLSNSYLLEKEFGWNGICAEPNPKFFTELQKNRNCIVCDACITGETGNKVDFVTAEEFGTISDYMTSDMHSSRRQAYKEVSGTIPLVTISLNDFLIKYKAPREIDYMSIDTEGSELDILKEFPFENWNVKLLSVEHNFTPERFKIRDILKNYGYSCIEARWDDWYFKKEKTDGTGGFS